MTSLCQGLYNELSVSQVLQLYVFVVSWNDVFANFSIPCCSSDHICLVYIYLCRTVL